MKKLREFITDLAKTGNIKSADLETAIAASGINEVELPDDFVTGFNASFLTVERAKNDPEIVAEIVKGNNRNVLNTVDEKIATFYQFLDLEDVTAIKKETKTFEKMDLLKAGLKKAKEAGKGKMNEDANKILEEKNAEITTMKATHIAELAKVKDEINTTMADGALTTKILAFKFAESFNNPEWRSSIAEIVKNNVRKKFTLSMDKGELKLLQAVQGSDSLVEAFEGNEKLTVNKLLEKELDKFIAKSNGGANGTGQNGNSGSQPNGGTPKLPDLKTATLAELRTLQAVQQ